MLRKFTYWGGGKESYFHNPFFNIGDSEVYLDVGAYNGDSVRAFVEATEGKYRKILAVEPEPKNFAELEKYVRDSNLHDVELFRNGCSDINGVVAFTDDAEGESFRASSQGKTQIEVRRIDQQFTSEDITLIKINLTMGPGTVKAINGAEKILQGKYPRMSITIALDERGLIDIPQAVKKINPNIKLSLMYSFPMPARLLLFGY
ncbi:MAG: FkbM family methyltransferase [Synergistaceae bacterium]|nr:FkbM family methyltransferase [Synergistaceae bacterium]